jgi:hypothetical protein
MAAPLRNPADDGVKAGAFRLTWISAAVGGIGAVVIAFNDSVLKIFGDHVSDGIKASLLITIIGAWALIAVADLFSRAIVTSADQRHAHSDAIAAPSDLRVDLNAGPRSDDWTLAAIRDNNGNGEGTEYLVVKKGEAPKWVKQGGIAAGS